MKMYLLVEVTTGLRRRRPVEQDIEEIKKLGYRSWPIVNIEFEGRVGADIHRDNQVFDVVVEEKDEIKMLMVSGFIKK